MANRRAIPRERTEGWHEDERRWLERFREALAADYGNVVKRALLFGSRARGDWREESDIDVMVIVKDEAAEAEESISGMAYDVLYEAGCWKAAPSVLTRTESEWARGLKWESGFHETVEQEGITLL